MKVSSKKTHPTPTKLNRAKMRIEGKEHSGTKRIRTNVAARPLGLGVRDSHEDPSPKPPAMVKGQPASASLNNARRCDRA
eukprot:scaffold260718_cov41-Tisochrysis_lutea.AAC.2